MTHFKLPLRLAALSLCALMFLASGCTKKKQIWIYTSLYKDSIAEMDPALHAALPDIEIKWYHGGSENVASKVNTEIAAGKAKADLILTSDPFWYQELKEHGKLLAYDSPAAKEVPADYRDPENYYVNVRNTVMVIGYNSEAIAAKDAPQSWKDLRDPKWKDKISSGSPLESGTTFTTVALLSRLYGWDYFKDLRKLNLVSAGGNSSVMTRIETRERPVGIILLENIIKGQANGSPVRAIYPTDGVIPIPSPIAILKDSENPELAKKVYDWFFSQPAQNAIIHGGMYSGLPKFAAPDLGMAWPEMQTRLMKWSPKLVTEIYTSRDQIKAKFSEIVLH